MKCRQKNENLHARANHNGENITDSVVYIFHKNRTDVQAGEITAQVNGLHHGEHFLGFLHGGAQLGVVQGPHRGLHTQKKVG